MIMNKKKNKNIQKQYIKRIINCNYNLKNYFYIFVLHYS